MSFGQFNLDPCILKALKVCKQTTPTPIQKEAIPFIMEGEDVVACAPTGTGKTAAFVLPALHHLMMQQPANGPRPNAGRNARGGSARVLILSPTRELANQIMQSAMNYSKFCHFKIISLVGGMSYHHQNRDLQRGADIIVATPGRLLDHIRQKHLALSGIEVFVLDEADRMLDMGFIDDVQKIASLTPKQRQTLLFSATFDKKLAATVKHLLNNPVRVDVSHHTIAAPSIHQEIYKVKNIQAKNQLLEYLLANKNIYKALIFSATKIYAHKLTVQLQQLGFEVEALHGDMKQGARNKTIKLFRDGKLQFLVATDVASRGIDIGDITHVINFDIPRHAEDYVHRIGRTGRAGKEGIAITFVTPDEIQHLKKIERFIGQPIKLQKIDPAAGIETGASFTEKPRRKRTRRSEGANRRSQGADRKSEGANRRSQGSDRRSQGSDRRSEGADRRSEGADKRKPKKFIKHKQRKASKKNQSKATSVNATPRKEKPKRKRKHKSNTKSRQNEASFM